MLYFSIMALDFWSIYHKKIKIWLPSKKFFHHHLLLNVACLEKLLLLLKFLFCIYPYIYTQLAEIWKKCAYLFLEKLAFVWKSYYANFSENRTMQVLTVLGYHWQQFLQKNMKKRGFLTSSAFLYSSCRCVPNEKLMCNTYLIFDLIIYSAKHSTLRWNVKKYLVPVA